MSKQASSAKARITYYHRHENGVIERGRGALVERQDLDKFTHEEKLQGWHESVVRRNKKPGRLMGWRSSDLPDGRNVKIVAR